ncbi:ABC transporter substrate-binding protein [Schleiferilactobacillus shenzhenensis]|uniref:Uncharacterized protein n=1 Tax=Schleiferilactobacillus shenzhenensis LY-73 TaxID=1231336 RepID=U4TRE5_9LACO|nr:extracellular solute-binding protein [Schleiferilactobacillus shenzhenensis]ERL64077.1 hypothetical protein L248_1610 [Schleiferilactobacillus shenzhenensis LY-73]
MKLTKVMAMIASTALIVLLGACGSGNSSNTASSSKKNDKITLTYLDYDGTRDANNNLVSENMAKAYHKLHPNITVKVDLQAENNSVDFLKKLDLLQMSGTTGDIIHTPSYREYSARAAKGFFADITSNFDKEGGYKKLYDYDATVSGKQYAVPFQPGIYMTFINKTMLDAAGEKLPTTGWTWDDYAKLAKKLTKGSGSNKVYGSYMHIWPEFRREGLFNSVMDNPYIKKDGTSNLKSSQFTDWLTFMKGLETSGSQLPYSDAKATNMNYRDVFLQGKAGMIVMGTWFFDDILNTQKFPHDFQTVLAPFPVFENGKAGVTQGAVSYLSVAKKSKHPKEAYDFIRYMSGKGSVAQNIFPSTKGGDIASVLKAKIGKNTKLLDATSALSIWDNKNMVPNMVTRDADKFVEIDSIFDTETQKFMLGNQSASQTMTNVNNQAKSIIGK